MLIRGAPLAGEAAAPQRRIDLDDGGAPRWSIGTNEIMHRTGKSKTCVWRWQKRFAEEGCDGLLREKTRPPRIPPLGADVAERVPVPCRSFATVSASLRTNWRIGPKGKKSQQRSFGLSDVGLSISTRR